MKCSDIIKLLESTNSRLEKESIIKQNLHNSEFIEGLHLCLNPLVTFGVKSIPECKSNESVTAWVTWDAFKELAKSLYQRKISGNGARDEIERIKNNSDSGQWNFWYKRILEKDLGCGVSVKTVNKCLLKDAQIPVFSCQLAQDFNDQQSKMVGEKIIEHKLDGVRVLTIVYPDGNVTQYSRNGKELLNFTKIVNQFKELAPSLKVPTVFDGEVMSSSFQSLMKQVHRKESINTDDSILYLFDIIPLNEFLKGVSTKTQLERTKDLHNFMAPFSFLENLYALEYQLVNLDTKEGKQQLSEINRIAIENNYEGIMIKDVDGKYECKRSSKWLKMKPFITVELQIEKVLEGSGKYAGTFGSFVCAGNDYDKFIRVNVGSGFGDEDREYLWKTRDILIGKTIEIKADSITKPESSEEYSLRFPVYLGFRRDK